MKKSVVLSGVLAAIFSAYTYSEPSAFILGSLGQAKVKANEYNESSTSFGIGGGYWFNENFAIEGRYDDFGEFDQTYLEGTATQLSENSASAFGLNILAGVPLNDQFKVYAKIGISFWDIETSGHTTFSDDRNGFQFNEKYSGNDFTYGFGAEYKASDAISIGAEYTSMTLKDVEFSSIPEEPAPDDLGDINNLNIYARLNF